MEDAIMTTAAIRPEKILRELDELWVSLGKQQENGEESAGVLRACSGTLIVLAQGTRDEGEVADTLAQIMREHPSRAIVMRLVEGDSPVLEAGVRALCWKPFGSRQQICCERVEIQFSEGSVAGVTSLARSLTAPDLPITLWCKSRHMLADGGYQAVLQLAGKVIIDSAGVADLAGQLALIRGTATPGRSCSDVSDLPCGVAAARDRAAGGSRIRQDGGIGAGPRTEHRVFGERSGIVGVGGTGPLDGIECGVPRDTRIPAVLERG
jgi:hypothetical protein